MIDYLKAKALAADADPAARLRVAERPDVQPEILYFLAEDQDARVRGAVAANSATPRHADLILAKDTDQGIRERIAHKVARLAPALSQEEQANIRELTYQVISILAADRTARIRQIVAEALKDLTDAPPEIVRSLARDVEIEVAGPVLEHSPLLSDAELIEIIQSKPIQGALTAIARRRRLGLKLTDSLVAAAVAAPEGTLAVATLLRNHDAEIDSETMERILDLAPSRIQWHEPLVQRPILAPAALRRLAGFVSHALLKALQQRSRSDPETAIAIAAIVERRLATEDGDAAGATEEADEDLPADALPVGVAAISSALRSGAYPAAIGALARDSGYPQAVIRKTMAAADPKTILALAWKAGYPAALAAALQSGPGHIPAGQVLAPSEGSEDYPLPESDLEWQLDLIKVPSTRLSREIGRLRSA